MPLAIIKELIPVSEERIHDELSFQARLSGVELKPYAKETKINIENKKKAIKGLNDYVTEIRKNHAGSK